MLLLKQPCRQFSKQCKQFKRTQPAEVEVAQVVVWMSLLAAANKGWIAPLLLS